MGTQIDIVRPVILKMYITVLYFERGTLAVRLNARLSVKRNAF